MNSLSDKSEVTCIIYIIYLALRRGIERGEY